MKHVTRICLVSVAFVAVACGDGNKGSDSETTTAAPSAEKKDAAEPTPKADLPDAATRSDRARFFKAYLAAGGREVLAPELAEWGARGIGQRVAEQLAAREAKKARRHAKGYARPAPTDLSALQE